MKKPLKIFYDGACLVCHTEIEIYRKHDINKAIEFVDISVDDFDYYSIPVTKKNLNKYFHIQTPNGLFIHGVSAFMEIWQLLPKWQLLEKLTNNIICRPGMKIGYFLFVYIRPYLPKRRNCESGSCNI